MLSEYFPCSLLAPSVGPGNISLFKLNETTFNISWAFLPREKSYGKVILYEVKQDLKGLRSRRSTAYSKVVNSKETFVVLYELQMCAQYHVSVRAYTSAGPGPYSPNMLLETSSKYTLNRLKNNELSFLVG